MDATKSKKKAVILAVSIAAAAVLVGIVLAAVAGGGKAVLQDQLNLGAKYLEELNYERAVAAYEAALKIDPKNTAAYEGIVAAYRGMGDAAKAAEYAQKGYEETGAESLSALLALLNEEEEGEDGGYLTELFDIGGYESCGLAYGGSIPVQKNEKWGAVNFQNEVIVPFEYDGFWAAPDQSGHFVLYNSTFETSEWGYEIETRDYFLFDNEGNTVYQGADMVRSSGGMYITEKNLWEDDYSCLEYHSMDGKLLAIAECEWTDNPFSYGFYDGISNLYSSVGGESGNAIGTVDLQGNLSWREAPDYTRWKEEMAARQAEEAAHDNGSVSGIGNANAASAVSYLGKVPISTVNHGYYAMCGSVARDGRLEVYDAGDKKVAEIFYFGLAVDENGRVTNDESMWNESTSFRGFWVDGFYIFNYGSKMVFTVGEKCVLIDFAKNTAGADSFSTEGTVLAVYDDIAMADGKYWLAQSGERWGYIDHEGNELAMYQDAGAFVNGYALIKENGEAWLIDESFQKLENLGPADSVSVLGELYHVTVGEERRLYALTGAGRK